MISILAISDILDGLHNDGPTVTPTQKLYKCMQIFSNHLKIIVDAVRCGLYYVGGPTLHTLTLLSLKLL